MANSQNPVRLTDTPTEIKQTAGRNQLGDFAPKFAQLNDDVLFGEVWSRTDKLSLRDRSIVTVTALVSSGIIDSSLSFHLQEAKKNGVVTVGITNNPNSSVGSIVDYHIQTATREKLFLNEICFSRVSAMTVIEVLYLFLTVGQERSYDRTSYCESLIADEKL